MTRGLRRLLRFAHSENGGQTQPGGHHQDSRPRRRDRLRLPENHRDGLGRRGLRYPLASNYMGQRLAPNLDGREVGFMPRHNRVIRRFGTLNGRVRLAGGFSCGFECGSHFKTLMRESSEACGNLLTRLVRIRVYGIIGFSGFSRRAYSLMAKSAKVKSCKS